MSGDEMMVFILSAIGAVIAAIMLSVSRLHYLKTRGNPGIGLHRLVVLASVIWAGYVMEAHGDASIQGVYVVFYLMLAYAAVKLFGQLLGPAILGVFVRREVFVRGNRPIALFTAAFALATGLIAGSCLWGEADPLGDDEGGWWIPVGFFVMGWGILTTATALYVWRGGRFHMQVRREHDMRAAMTASVFVLASAAVIAQGVAGDFWGWIEGLLSMGTIALMLIGHELLAARGKGGDGRPGAMSEFMEQFLFIGLAVLCWWLNQWVARNFTGALAGG